MTIQCEDYSNICVVGIAADLAGDAVGSLRSRITERFAQSRIVDYVIDLTHCRFIDSSGLEALLWVKQKAEDLLGQVKLVHADDSIMLILQMTRLDHRFECIPDLATALKTMR